MTVKDTGTKLIKLNGNDTGISAVEFGLIAPFFMLMLIGLFDLGFQMYANSVLQGALQQTSRQSTLENGAPNLAALDADVTEAVVNVLPNAEVTLTRRNYASFSDLITPEAWTDTDDDGTCNDGEPFEDLNDNGAWDSDRGRDGLGGARDAVLYTAVVDYERMFPFAEFVGIGNEVRLTASSVLRNQPYNEQGQREPSVGACT